MLDLLIIKPGAQEQLYQGLSESLTGLEPPLWSALLAGYLRQFFMVDIVDVEVEPDKIMPTIIKKQPRLIAIVVSGTNPSASTMNMVGARAVLEEINSLNIPTILVGLHPSALPRKTLEEEPVTMVCEGEGFYTLEKILFGFPNNEVRGLWFKQDNGWVIGTKRAKLIDPNAMPMPAWDLLSMGKYRAHNWMCYGHLEDRSSYGVIYTSLGCPFNCSFCCINAIFGEHKIRYRDPKKVIEEIDFLVRNYSIRNIKIMDEMFDLNEKHVTELCDLIIDRKYHLNMWAYARVDTINESKLRKMKQAGINWLGIGFESANKQVRDNVRKGKFDNKKIKQTVKMIRDAGISIAGNFMFGLPGDTLETMQETLNLAKDINCEMVNFNTTMAYPGSELYKQTPETDLPSSWEGFSQHGYETQPLPTDYLTSAEVLEFRDKAFQEYHSSKRYQHMIKKKFGNETLKHIQQMLKHKLKRRLLEE